MSALAELAINVEVEPLALNARTGDPRPTYANIALILSAFGDRIRFEEFSGRIVCSDLGPDGEWTDAHSTLFVEACEGHRLYVTPAAVDRAVEKHARMHAYNVLTDFVTDCATRWDSKPRVDRAFSTYWGAKDTPATRAAARVFFLSLVARALEPGAKVDTCPVFVGPQGAGKSTALCALVSEAWFSDSPLAIGDKDALQNLQGTWLQEFSENESLSRKEKNAVKAFLSARIDKFRASYGHHAQRVARQTCFAASTNEAETLTDSTGERRYLPVTVGSKINVEGIARDREQLIGEAAYRVFGGESYWPTLDESKALDSVRDAHKVHDAWEDLISVWVAKLDGQPFTMAELLASGSGAFVYGQDAGATLSQHSQNRAGAILRKLGFEPKREQVNATRAVRWHRKRQSLPPGATRFR